MSQAGKKKSNIKKKHQDEWDDMLKFIRSVSRDLGLPTGMNSNAIIKLCEELGEGNNPFPPKSVIVSKSWDTTLWIRVLMQTLMSKQCQTYTNIFATKTYQGLRALCFWGVEVGDEGTQWIVEALPMLPHCIKLELIDAALGALSCEHLAGSLKRRRYTNLKILRLDHNGLIGSTGLSRLADGLFFNALLHTLSLAYCNITSDGGIYAQAILLTKGIGIKNLNLEGNRLEREGVKALAQGLAGNHSLTHLNIGINHFGGDGDKNSIGELDAIKYLTAALQTAPALKSLNMDGNLIGSAGVSHLYHAAMSGTISHVQEIVFTPFVECQLYKALMIRLESHAPKKTKKKKKKKAPAKK